MNPEEKDLLQKTYDLTKENNEMLHGVKRHNRRSTIFTIVYWVLIIGASVGALYIIQPYIDLIVKTYKEVQGNLVNVKKLF